MLGRRDVLGTRRRQRLYAIHRIAREWFWPIWPNMQRSRNDDYGNMAIEQQLRVVGVF